MSNISFSVLETEKLEALIAKVNKVYEILNAERQRADRVYPNKEACKYLNVCSKTLQNYRDSGLIRFSQAGRKIYYTQSNLDEFLIENKKELFKKEIINFN